MSKNILYYQNGAVQLTLSYLAHSLEDRLKQQTFDENHPKKLNQPTQTELCETVLLLRQIMPHRSLERSITMLYETLVKQKTPQEIYEVYGIEPPAPQPQPRKSPETEITKTYLKADTNKVRNDFSSENEWNRYKDKRAVAKSFVDKGYGHQFAIQKLNQASLDVPDQSIFSFNKDVYKQTISAVITQAFRRLQTFIAEDCKKRITPIGKPEMKKLMTPLLSSSAFKGHIDTFKKYLKYLYGLTNVTLVQGESVRLYLEVMRFLNGRPITMEEIQARSPQNAYKPQASETNSQNQDNIKNPNQAQKHSKVENQSNGNTKKQQSVISSEQTSLANFYIQYHSLSKCFTFLTHKYESINKLRSKLFSILKKALNKVESESERSTLNDIRMQKLNDRAIEAILVSKSGLSIRLLLLKYAIQSDNRNLRQLVESINDFTSIDHESAQGSLRQESEAQKNDIMQFEDTNEVKQEDQLDFEFQM